jgi:hypothetical protein
MTVELGLDAYWLQTATAAKRRFAGRSVFDPPCELDDLSQPGVSPVTKGFDALIHRIRAIGSMEFV